MKLSHSTREKIFSEIFEHMKSSGAFDEIRVGLIDPIWSHSKFQHIVENFELECERFCKDFDLNQTRSYLRNKLSERFEHSSTSKDLLKDHVYRFLSEKDSALRSKYCEYAREFLKKFLPITSRPQEELVAVGDQKKLPEPQLEDMDIGLTDDDDDELERLTFSSVSTVSTAELKGYDNLIELSDDEANIVGKPKNSSVPIEVVQGQINDLLTTGEEGKPSEMPEASESDGGCSETTNTGKRAARTRKSNPRYMNGDFKLL